MNHPNYTAFLAVDRYPEETADIIYDDRAWRLEGTDSRTATLAVESRFHEDLFAQKSDVPVLVTCRNCDVSNPVSLTTGAMRRTPRR